MYGGSGHGSARKIFIKIWGHAEASKRRLERLHARASRESDGMTRSAFLRVLIAPELKSF